ncbi:bifunctional 2-polyprenyl-6-hydroxyphenol methylase/3-demethylubiquinol 3-O-methyltransferase UbiG [Blochmannia endosymbiont of Polyrhachis (Hedomyrma) turneri]|uniref:bifunctional 2-polyprenyl-6-hydroxyphenol methylase/3-demethylubiquinol 3-O-methyltransferase UbiG n=1 Tax=Blochmannia endosymbiont of Polyrhachis (Hedomyrma) turneri TaxID=1505596 RepID=UPI00061A890C|nr:bifunctional 2-polyprenyl-6-hydroxyphenol methylase/3-demethylubiquinol 3-O-methyltransferase UbiG [Blochmannia endosymbiont of Polyrhachis (Hedomyrma) turneri]AKC60039.1 3-demethylubiquinone-9 3-methyltransferase [Blochmannia endosymbiont of Polyrhachis (Hedomyrma) turneri]
MNDNNNIDYNEKIKFDTLFNHWWDKNGTFKILHQINPIRLKYITNCSNGIFKKKILDVGCGGGILSESMAEKGAHVTGLDIGENTIQAAQKHANQQKIQINYINETIEQHARKNKHKYDIITCMEVLEHVPNPISIIQSCAYALKINGNIFFSTLNRTIISWLIIIGGAEYIFNILPYGTHQFKKFIKPSELLAWTDTAHLQAKKIIGLSFNIISKKYKLSNNLNTNYILHAKHITQ